MQVFRGEKPLDANFRVERVEGTQTVLYLSRGGNPIRNADYNEGLETVLRRLAGLHATLETAAVDSADTRRAGLGRAARTLDPGSGRTFPLNLADERDIDELRLALGRSQAAVGRAATGSRGGNNTKQIRLELTFPDPAPSDAELERLLAYGARVLVVALPRSAQKNLEWGLESGVWGFPIPRFAGTETARVKEYKSLRRGDTVLLMAGYTGGSPRAPFDKWTGASTRKPHSFDDCYVCRVNQPYYVETTPFWPDELHLEQSRYSHRIGIDPESVGALSLEAGVDLSADVILAARRSHLQGAQGFLADATGSPRLETLQVTAPAQNGRPPAKGPVGQGRAVDPIRKKRVEDHAVAVARAQYEKDGWNVVDVSKWNDETYGTPYDLRCTKSGVERHVEVKGTTGSGETVLLSANERRHAEASKDATSFLFVVAQIGIKTVGGEVKAVGGDVRYHGPLLVEDSRFTPTQFQYVVPPAASESILAPAAAT